MAGHVAISPLTAAAEAIGEVAGLARDVMDLKPHLDTAVAGGEVTEAAAGAVAEAVATGSFDPVQLAALLALWAARGESPALVTAFARVLSRHAVPVTLPPTLPPTCDIVGTGGDGHDTVNISTAAAVVAAAAGVPIAKHGSVSVSSRSGSADVLACLGVAPLPPAAIGPCLQRAGIAFMFAPLFHPALRHVVPVRKSLRIRTLFNILGPLLNPAHTPYSVLGVFTPRLLRVYAHAAARLGCRRALIVHCCGLDELAPLGPCAIVEVDGTTTARGTDTGPAVGSTSDPCLDDADAGHGDDPFPVRMVDPLEWGVPRCSLSDLKGGTPADNAATLRSILAGDVTTRPAVAHAIAMNAGACLYVTGRAASLRDGYASAWETLASGAPAATLRAWAAACADLTPL